MLSAQHLVKSFAGRRVIEDVTLSLERGEIVGLLGPNGAGKSTTFQMLTGMIPPDAGAITLDGSESASVQFAQCCRPIPGDKILGYLGRGEGLVVHMSDCPVALKLRHKESERFIGVDWSEEPVRSFKTGITVTSSNSKGMLAKMATALAAAEADIIDIDMGQEGRQEDRQLRFLVAVRDTAQLEVALRNLRHTPSVIKAERSSGANAST